MFNFLSNKFFWIESIGVMGAMMVLGGYFLLSANYLDSNSVVYQLLNIIGSILLLGYSIYKKAWANVGINFIWMVIGLFALVNIIF